MKIPLVIAEESLLDLQNTHTGFFDTTDGWIVLFAYLTACVVVYRYARRNRLNRLLAVSVCLFIPFGVVLIALAPWWLIISCFIGVPVLSNVKVKVPPGRNPHEPGLN